MQGLVGGVCGALTFSAVGLAAWSGAREGQNSGREEGLSRFKLQYLAVYGLAVAGMHARTHSLSFTPTHRYRCEFILYTAFR
jgi:hypothetical protein